MKKSCDNSLQRHGALTEALLRASESTVMRDPLFSAQPDCAGVALIGYYMAAAVVDNRYIGRLRLQLLGFAFVAVLFYVSAIFYHPLTTKGGIQTFQFVSSFLYIS